MLDKQKYYEVVGIFSSVESLNEAADQLFSIGFNPYSLSLLSRNQINKQKSEENNPSIENIAKDRETLRTSFQAEENVSIAEGAVISTLMYIGVVGTAALVIINRGSDSNLSLAFIVGIIAVIIGVILAMMIKKYHQKYIDYQLRKGGLILWIHLEKKSQSPNVIKILKGYKATKVHLRSYVGNP